MLIALPWHHELSSRLDVRCMLSDDEDVFSCVRSKLLYLSLQARMLIAEHDLLDVILKVFLDICHSRKSGQCPPPAQHLMDTVPISVTPRYLRRVTFPLCSAGLQLFFQLLADLYLYLFIIIYIIYIYIIFVSRLV